MMTQDELSQRWVPDRKLWLDLSKEQQAQRKEQWKLIQRTLKILSTTKLKKGYIKAHKALFFKGEMILTEEDLGRQGSGIFGGAYPLFYLWYIPELSPEKCQELIQYFSQGPFFFVKAQPILSMRSIIFQNLNEDYSANGEYGVMGERMAVIAPCLLGYPGKPTFFEQVSEGVNEVYRPKQMIGYLKSTIRVLKNFPGSNFEHSQYIWPQGSYYLKALLEFLRDPPQDSSDYDKNLEHQRLERFINTVEMVLFFDEHPDTAKDNQHAIACRDRIIGHYEKGELAPEMIKLFDQIKINGLGNTTIAKAIAD